MQKIKNYALLWISFILIFILCYRFWKFYSKCNAPSYICIYFLYPKNDDSVIDNILFNQNWRHISNFFVDILLIKTDDIFHIFIFKLVIIFFLYQKWWCISKISMMIFYPNCWHISHILMIFFPNRSAKFRRQERGP